MATSNDNIITRNGALESPWQSGLHTQTLKTTFSSETLYDALITDLATALML